MPRLDATEVQVTFTDGQVLHFLVSAGDTVSVQEIETRIGKQSENLPVHYYVIQCARAGEGSNDRHQEATREVRAGEAS